MMNAKLALHFSPHRQCFEVYAHVHPHDPLKQIVGKPVVFEQTPANTAIMEPTFKMDKNDVQELMNDLWRQGFRPENVSETIGELNATKRHLSDFRKIASKTLEIDLD